MDESKVVVITGASGGIGAALARQLGREGHRVVLAARRADALQRVAEEVGARARPVVADVTRRVDVERLRDVAIDAFGHVDVWVNNVGRGINVPSFLGRVPLAAFRSAYNAAKAALNALTANLRMDLRREWPNIHVSLVMPGLVDTEFARNSLGGTPERLPTAGGRALAVQSAEQTAADIVHLIAEPRAELYTEPSHPAVVRRYFDDVDAFERALGH